MLHRNWWRWCRSKKIRGNKLLVLLAIEAGPWGAGQYTGLFYISPADIADFTGLDDREVSRTIKLLERMDVIVYDRRKQIVFVRGMLERQSPSFASSENNLQGVSNHVERMPEGSPAVEEFIKAQNNTPELYELLEGYLEGESEGYSEQTLDLRPEDLDTSDQKTVIAPKDSDDDAPLKTFSLTPNDKGNGKDQGAVKGKDKGIRFPSSALQTVLMVRLSEPRQRLEKICRQILDGELGFDALGAFDEYLEPEQTSLIRDSLRKAIEAHA
jgi:hypothetical protein